MMRPDIKVGVHEGGLPSGSEQAFRAKFGIPDRLELPQDTVRVLQRIQTANPAIRPLFGSALSDDAKARWMVQFPRLFRDEEAGTRIGQKLISGVTRIPEDRFEDALVGAFSDAQAAVLAAGFDPDRTRFIYYGGWPTRSETWTQDICRDYFPDSPVLAVPTIDYYDQELTGDYDTGIILNDASYTGTQVVDHLHWGNKRFGMKKFFVIVPFMTNEALRQTLAAAKERGVEVQIFMKENMATVRELLGEDDFKALQANTNPPYHIEDGQTVTYFAHKVPDYRSLSPYVGNPHHIYLADRLDTLVPKEVAPYSHKYFDDLKSKGLL